MNKLKTEYIAISAICVAIQIILSRFLAIQTSFFKLGFQLLPIIFVAIYLGCKYSIMVSVISDILGAYLFPKGQYFIGFTITALVAGIIFGILLYKCENIYKVVIAVVLYTLICSLFLNTMWISYLNNISFAKVLFTNPFRIMSSLANCILNIILGVILVSKDVRRLIKTVI